MAITTVSKGKVNTSAVGQAVTKAVVTSAASMLNAAQQAITSKSTHAVGSGQAKAKETRPVCTTQGCKLHAAEGLTVCSNHRPAHLKMESSDRNLLSAWLTSITPDERLIAFASVFGPVKSTELAKQLRSAGWTPTTAKQ